MPGRRSTLLAVALALTMTSGVAAAATPGPASVVAPDVAADVGAASLAITPDEFYVGGQGIRWTGSIGVAGERRITMERFLGREGDQWEEVPDFRGRTDEAGRFAFWYPAPSMRGLAVRVVSGQHRTPEVILMALQPDLVLWVSGDDRDDPDDIGSAVAGEPFAISVDTTPKLTRRGDTEGLLPIPGRTLTLQRRADGSGDQWSTLGRTEVDADGMGYFPRVTEREPGEVVYRVRQEDWTKKHDEIGWSPSFPTYVDVAAQGTPSVPAMGPAAPATAGAPTDPSSTDGTDGTDAGKGLTAARRYHWLPALYDFAWERGESLTSPPWRGKKLKGSWLDYTDGGGRVSKEGGGVVLDSKRDNIAGPGDFGTTKATLAGNPVTVGRWETKLWLRADEDDAQDYVVRLELVPAASPDDACRTVTVAEITDHGDTVAFGVNARTSRWTGSEVIGPVDNRPMSFALEITDDHMTWFLDSEPLGTVQDPAAILGIPMTLRMSMIGDGGREMNRTTLKSDWQRGFDLVRGEQVSTGAPLEREALGDC